MRLAYACERSYPVGILFCFAILDLLVFYPFTLSHEGVPGASERKMRLWTSGLLGNTSYAMKMATF